MKHYVFYEDDDAEYLPLKIAFSDVPGYYNIFNDDSKTMNFKLDDDSLGKIIDIFDHIGEILKIDLYHYSYDGNNGITYVKPKVSDDTDFRKNMDKTTNTIPNERTGHNCRAILQIQSVYYNNKEINEDIDYYPQMFLQQRRYTSFINNKLLHDVLDFADFEPDSESESDEVFNDDTA